MNCKPGDLAYSVVEPYKGRVFEVVSFWGDYQDHPLWNVRACEPLLKFKAGRRDCPGGVSRDGCMYDQWLRPISGVPITDDVKDEVPA